MKQKPYLMMALGLIVGLGVGILGTYYMVNRNNVEELITSQQARDIVINKVPGSTIQEFLYDNEDGVAIYESLLQKDNSIYEVDVDAKTGDIIKFEEIDVYDNDNPNTSNNNQNNTQNNPSSYIGEEKAKSIMLNKVPGATIINFNFDNDTTPEYEGELRKGNMEYDISVDAKTGDIIDFTKEPVDTIND